MNNKSKRYTPEEDEAIFRAVQDCTTSLKACFIAVAQQLGRTPAGVQTRWWTVLSNPDHPKYKGTAMILMKRHSTGVNRTNITKFPVEMKLSWWKRILKTLGL